MITDGDVQAALATAMPETGVDVLMGIGGAPEGVIAAAALKCIGGNFQGQFCFRNDLEKTRAKEMGIKDLTKIYTMDELASGHVMFCATGVTQGTFLNGVRYFSGGAHTHSVVMRSESGTIRHIDAEHHFDRKPRF